MLFLVQVYYTHPGFRTSIFGKNRAYCIRDFTVSRPAYKLTRIPTAENVTKN